MATTTTNNAIQALYNLGATDSDYQTLVDSEHRVELEHLRSISPELAVDLAKFLTNWKAGENGQAK